MTSYQLIADLAFGDYLEIGVQEGGSMCAAVGNGRVTSGTGIDTWGNESGGTGRGSSEHVIKRLGPLASRVQLITGSSHDILKTINRSFDTIYVDGDHSAAGCLEDLEDCLKLLRPDGLLIVDDLDNPSCPHIRQVTSQFAAKHNLQIEYVDAHLGIAVMGR